MLRDCFNNKEYICRASFLSAGFVLMSHTFGTIVDYAVSAFNGKGIGEKALLSSIFG